MKQLFGWGNPFHYDIVFVRKFMIFTIYSVILKIDPAKNRGHNYAIIAYRMSDANRILTIFFHHEPAVFKVNRVENVGKSRK